MTVHNATLIYGDGIGAEVIASAKKIIEETGVPINWEICEAGAEVFKKGLATGIPNETIESIKRTRIALKGPLSTPVGYGEKSANVTLRKLFETYANIRPIKEFPKVPSPYNGRGIDLVIVRENVEDLYAGIEYMQTPNAAQCLKLISRKGCDKIIKLAFEFVRSENRKTLHCASKANIMKLTEGMMKQRFEEIAKDYPEIDAQHIIIDNCAHQLVRFPEKFDTIVTTNMNGDIISDLASGLIGGLGFAPGANIGQDVAIFEAVHGSAPKYAGLNTINPTAVILSGVMMLRHMGEFEAANSIEQAIYVTLGIDKVSTRDVSGSQGVSTTAYTEAIMRNLGKTYVRTPTRQYKPIVLPRVAKLPVVKTRRVMGIDVFIESNLNPADLAAALNKICTQSLFNLKMICNRGTMVYPSLGILPDVGDLYRCRFILKDEESNLKDNQLIAFLGLLQPDFQWMHLEKLNVFEEKLAYTRAQGED
ncbi:MAG: NADP-dependent isocitrate dehydrogenase [Alphaproteobacteria bacterium]|nr:NADP-dependent isocitrate dehydrogenase [Alphaproteobacteria bacterium]